MISDKLHKRTMARFGKTEKTGAINECFRPSNEASKADLAEYHAEEMRLRRARRRA